MILARGPKLNFIIIIIINISARYCLLLNIGLPNWFPAWPVWCHLHPTTPRNLDEVVGLSGGWLTHAALFPYVVSTPVSLCPIGRPLSALCGLPNLTDRLPKRLGYQSSKRLFFVLPHFVPNSTVWTAEVGVTCGATRVPPRRVPARGDGTRRAGAGPASPWQTPAQVYVSAFVWTNRSTHDDVLFYGTAYVAVTTFQPYFTLILHIFTNRMMHISCYKLVQKFPMSHIGFAKILLELKLCFCVSLACGHWIILFAVGHGRCSFTISIRWQHCRTGSNWFEFLCFSE